MRETFIALDRIAEGRNSPRPCGSSIKEGEPLFMNARAFLTLWIFIFLAAAYDSYFAYSYRAVLDQWELNPLVRLGSQLFGLPAVFGFKALALFFAIGLASYCRRHHLGFDGPITWAAAGPYLVLSAHYFFSAEAFAAIR